MSSGTGESQGQARLDYSHLAPEGMARLKAFEHYLNVGSGLPSTLQEFVRLLASRINGCEYCIHLHTEELKKLNETPDRIAGVTAWRGSDLYTPSERAALGWAAALTNIQQGHAPDEVYNEVRAHFNEVETVNLTLTITSINAWNRLAIALGAHANRG